MLVTWYKISNFQSYFLSQVEKQIKLLSLPKCNGGVFVGSCIAQSPWWQCDKSIKAEKTRHTNWQGSTLTFLAGKPEESYGEGILVSRVDCGRNPERELWKRLRETTESYVTICIRIYWATWTWKGQVIGHIFICCVVISAQHQFDE